MWGAVAALLLFAIYISWETIQVRKTIDTTSEQMRIEVAKQQELQREFAETRRQAILADRHSVKISMVPESRDMPSLDAVWHPKLGLVIAGQNVSMPPANRTFQLWLVPKTPGGKRIPCLTLLPDADRKFILLIANPPVTLDATKTLIITEEPAGGSHQPTTKPRWRGAIG